MDIVAAYEQVKTFRGVAADGQRLRGRPSFAGSMAVSPLDACSAVGEPAQRVSRRLSLLVAGEHDRPSMPPLVRMPQCAQTTASPPTPKPRCDRGQRRLEAATGVAGDFCGIASRTFSCSEPHGHQRRARGKPE